MLRGTLTSRVRVGKSTLVSFPKSLFLTFYFQFLHNLQVVTATVKEDLAIQCISLIRSTG